MKDAIQDIKKVFEGHKEDNHKAVAIPDHLKKNKKVAIVTENEVEDTEFFYPYYRFNEEGYEVDVITENGGEFKGKHGLGLKDSKAIDQVDADDYEMVYLPGGKAPQKLRENEMVLDFVRNIANKGKIVAAICHGPQVLISAGLVKDKKIAAYPEVKGELEKAGATYVDEALQIDGQYITARKPGDLHRHLQGVLEHLNARAY
ncbi:MAG: type 1 glutamine amidotransferase domain-containing protein [Pseudomonadota bacterium]